MSLFRNEYTLQSCKSKQTLYEQNITRFKDENYKGKITEDGFKVFKRQKRHLIYRTSPYQGVFIGEIFKLHIWTYEIRKYSENFNQ